MLDTGPLIALYDPSDCRGTAVQALIQHMKQDKYPVCITRLTIAEAHNRILYDVNESQALAFLETITDGSIHILDLEVSDVSEAIAIIKRYPGQKITCTDAVSMAVMKRMGIRSVLSYDHHFWYLNFSVLPQGNIV